MSVSQTEYGENTVCPRCGGGIPNDACVGEYPGALSRVDSDTEICSGCGTAEAMFNYTNPGEELPPVTERIAPYDPWKGVA